jgi:hypothetical protein
MEDFTRCLLTLALPEYSRTLDPLELSQFRGCRDSPQLGWE